MKKKLGSDNIDAVKTFIESRIDAGYKKKAVFEDLFLTYDEKEKLARLIAQVPYPEDRRKNSLANMLLALTAFGFAMSKFMFLFGEIGPTQGFGFYFGTVLAALAFWFAKEVFFYRGSAYRPLGMLGVLALFNGPQPLWFYAVPLLMTAGSFYLARRMFPYLGLFAAKKKKDGSFKFGDN